MWNLIIIIPTLSSLILFFPVNCQAKIEADPRVHGDKEKELVMPLCSQTGEIYCPKGYRLNCPKQYKPACVFVGKSHLPACLADSADNTFFSYDLNKISCRK